MSQFCKNCGAPMADGERLCTNCGKVAPKHIHTVAKNENQFSAINQGMYENKQLTDVKRQFSPTMAASNQTLSKERQRVTTSATQKAAQNRKAMKMRNLANNNFDAQAKGLRPTEVETTSGNEKKSILHPMVNKIMWIIAGLVALYFIIGGIILIIYKNDTYDFETKKDEHIVAHTYGEAMHNYFESGWWHFRFTTGVTYVGKTADGDKYELHFTKKDGKRVVDEVKINGEKYEAENLMIAQLLPMFKAPEKR
jgi:hypothetical protein